MQNTYKSNASFLRRYIKRYNKAIRFLAGKDYASSGLIEWKNGNKIFDRNTASLYYRMADSLRNACEYAEELLLNLESGDWLEDFDAVALHFHQPRWVLTYWYRNHLWRS